jgi:hypothetical protein
MNVLIAESFEQSGRDGLAGLGCEVVFDPGVTADALPEVVTRLDPTVLVVRGKKVKAPAIVAGKPNDSLLLSLIATGKMPMGGAKLNPTEIDTIRLWIESETGKPPVAERDVQAYYLGPVGFMRLAKQVLHRAGVPDAQARCEFFGPAQSLAA